MRYSIGLDIGIASVGYAVLMLDESDKPCRIYRLGSRVFEKAENEDGSSLATPRRENRGMRRRLRRKRFRKERIRKLINRYGIMSYDEIDGIYHTEEPLSDIYEVRCRALDQKLTKEEFVRLLIHLSQRRGFKSNRKADTQDNKSDDGKLLTAVNENSRLMQEKGYRTIGEMLYKDEKFSEYKRNKSDDYSKTFARKDYEDEIKTVFAQQRSLGNSYASEELEKDYLKIYLSQRYFDEGPGGDSPYGGNLIEKMLGKCTFEFEKGELRSVKAAYSFEYSNLLQKINAIKIIGADGKRPLTDDERRIIKELAFNKNSISYDSLRKALKLSDEEVFNISYGEKDISEVEKKTKFTYLEAYHTLKKAFGTDFDNWSTDKKNTLAYILTVYKNDEKVSEKLREEGFTEEEISTACKVPTKSFKKTGNLCIKVLDKIIPYLEQGMLYNEACESAGYNFKADEKSTEKFLKFDYNKYPEKYPELADLTNPVVKRAISQTFKVINAIIRDVGNSPEFVNIELARELSKSFNDRQDIKKQQDKNRLNNEALMKELRETYKLLNPTGQDLVRLKLWKEQSGICPYSQRPIMAERLFEVGYTDIDHIIPYSISFDDTYNNKVLVFAEENRQKGNRLPMQYLTGERQDKFYTWVDNSMLRRQKKKNLLKEQIKDEDINEFKKRNLADTQYIASFILNFLKKHLELEPNVSGSKHTIKAVNGAATDYVRKRWGIQKIREDGDIHHAVDAVVIACIDDAMIKRISEYSKRRELKNIKPETGEVKDLFPTPYSWFRDELEMLCTTDPAARLHDKPLPNYATDEPLKPIFVSRMPQHKVSGPAHLETIKKLYTDADNIKYAIKKVSLTSLSLDKDGEIKDYYNKSSDTLLYNALRDRLIAFNGDGKKAFEDKFYKPKSDGTQGPLVKKVKIMEKTTMYVDVLKNTAIADNDSMVRTDVFYVEGEGYYLVPIYIADTVKDTLPNKAVVANKPYEQWKEMKDDNFLFSLYRNDLIKVKSKKGVKYNIVNKESTREPQIMLQESFAYYKGTDIATAAITMINHDNSYKARSIGVKSLLSIEKYQVDVLGNISKVNKEKRMGFNK
ncbi:MAG: type II CRISPR RNA-guided endonuclease Cas9 [Acutalibacteraceae bacterium]